MAPKTTAPVAAPKTAVTHAAPKTAVTHAAPATQAAVVKPTEKPKRVIVKMKQFQTTEPVKEALVNFDFATYKPLKKNDFAKVSLYFEHRAAEMDFKAARFRQEAIDSAKFGSGKEVQAAKRLVKMTATLETLKATLAAQGVDVEALLKSMLTAPAATK